MINSSCLQTIRLSWTPWKPIVARKTLRPFASMATWKSPVLLIQGDDDRNVSFHATVDIARRLDARGVSYEELVLPDEIHGFLRHQTWMTVDSATVAYLDKKLGVHPAP